MGCDSKCRNAYDDGVVDDVNGVVILIMMMVMMMVVVVVVVMMMMMMMLMTITMAWTEHVCLHM